MSILDEAVEAVDTVNSVNMLVYGQSGAGKTRFAGSGRENGKHDLILAVEQGTISAARAGSKAKVLKIENWNQLDEAVTAVIDEPDRFEWVIVDSLTKLQDVIWQHIVGEAVSDNPRRSEFKKELQEYGEAQERLKSVINRLNASEANIIYTATSDLETDEDANEFQMPSIHGQKGKLAHWVCAQVDVVCYLSVVKHKGQLVRSFQFNKTTEVFAKDRLALYPGKKGNLTLEEYTNKLLEESVEEDAPTDNTNTNDEEENK